MWSILVTLAIGFAIGRLNLIPERFKPYTQWITTGGLIFLLVSMGAGLSSNPDVLKQIKELGLHAFLIAAVSITGSVLLVWLVQQTFFKKKQGGETK